MPPKMQPRALDREPARAAARPACGARIDPRAHRRRYFMRPYFRMTWSIRSTGIAYTRKSFAPVVVSAASSAFVIAASVACAVA